MKDKARKLLKEHIGGHLNDFRVDKYFLNTNTLQPKKQKKKKERKKKLNQVY